MKLDYGTILCPEPITLSIGTVRSPTLREIGRLTFEKFGYYEYLLKLSPEAYYTEMLEEKGKTYWESLPDGEKEKVCLYDILLRDETLAAMYTEILDFFFTEPVIFREGFFILFKEDAEINGEDISTDDIRGVISKETFPQILEILQQICCIYEEEEHPEEIKFKNNLAKQLFEKMQKAKQKDKAAKKKADINYSLPNIISAVSNRHPTISPVNVWDLTVFQLLDTFNRTQVNMVYDIESTRVSVWGDEKKTFDVSLWHKNEYEKNAARP